jgi:hypothetical protein
MDAETIRGIHELRDRMASPDSKVRAEALWQARVTILSLGSFARGTVELALLMDFKNLDLIREALKASKPRLGGDEEVEKTVEVTLPGDTEIVAEMRDRVYIDGHSMVQRMLDAHILDPIMELLEQTEVSSLFSLCIELLVSLADTPEHRALIMDREPLRVISKALRTFGFLESPLPGYGELTCLSSLFLLTTLLAGDIVPFDGFVEVLQVLTIVLHREANESGIPLSMSRKTAATWNWESMALREMDHLGGFAYQAFMSFCFYAMLCIAETKGCSLYAVYGMGVLPLMIAVIRQGNQAIRECKTMAREAVPPAYRELKFPNLMAEKYSDLMRGIKSIFTVLGLFTSALRDGNVLDIAQMPCLCEALMDYVCLSRGQCRGCPQAVVVMANIIGLERYDCVVEAVGSELAIQNFFDCLEGPHSHPRACTQSPDSRSLRARRDLLPKGVSHIYADAGSH